MRIQHNIQALNSYNKLQTNNGNVSKNLEKLSSGFRINRAGDDAAGLAISEKMRAQITGLETAQKNANDGISLVQTAEGALTEVHSMLNRMSELATQSANGTYQNDVDRENIQKEVTSLKSEIDRISDSTNYNGINLLDGSLSKSKAADVSENIKLTDTTVTTASTKTGAFGDVTTALTNGSKMSYTVAWKDASGAEFSKTVKMTYKTDGATAANDKLVAEDGTEYDAGATTVGEALADKIGAAMEKEMSKDENFAATFKATYNATDNKFTFESKTAGAAGASITALGITGLTDSAAAATIAAADVVKGNDSYQKLDLSGVKIYGGALEVQTDDRLIQDTINASTFEFQGKKFVLVADDVTSTQLSKLGSDVNVIRTDVTGANTGAAYAKGTADANQIAVATEIGRVTGTELENPVAADVAAGGKYGTGAGIAAGDIIYKDQTKLTDIATGNGGLNLQVGDTAEKFNKVTVAVDSMGTKNLKIDDINVGTQKGAAEAVDKIKAAINSVSSTRGDLGAVQNRLEHTINNLSVTTENMTAAESRIRDTDMAAEMMKFTKNNILSQAAQSMLAQANQLPQGVLQLLQ